MNKIIQRIRPRLRRLYSRLHAVGAGQNFEEKAYESGRSNFIFSIDKLSYGQLQDSIELQGWFYCELPFRLTVELDEYVIATVSLQQQRADVRAVYPHIPETFAPGFDCCFDLRSSWFGNRGSSSLKVYAYVGGYKYLLAENPVFLLEKYPQTIQSKTHTQNFYFTVGSSNITQGGFGDFKEKLAPFSIGQCQLGFMVPLLYMRSTHGEAADWAFAPDFDENRKQGNGKPVIADSLKSILEYSISQQLPCVIGLNGGIWGDASGTCPEWDLTDWLENEPANCQWNQHDQVMPDDYMKHLTGAEYAPELSRALTLSHYNEQVRSYKKRNLQAAATEIIQFFRTYPELYIGSNLDPDCYQNPFFEGEQWYDFNPDNVQQFRDWLAGTGAYADELKHTLNHQPYTLQRLNQELGSKFSSWQEVQPPREHPSKPVVTQVGRLLHLWEQFRRHIVHRHYSDLTDWLIEAGLPARYIFSSQGFTAPRFNSEPFALRLDSPVKNYDSGGMSLAGSKPENGHIGAILYGESARNTIRTENDISFFQNIRALDHDWAVVEFNPADLRDNPRQLPDYAFAWDCLTQIFNHGARYINLMAWNGNSGKDVDKNFFSAHMALRDTPLQAAVIDFMLMFSDIPRGAVCYTFGSQRYGTGEGWSSPDTNLSAKNDGLHLKLAKQATLIPPQQYLLAAKRSVEVWIKDVAADDLKVHVTLGEGRLAGDCHTIVTDEGCKFVLSFAQPLPVHTELLSIELDVSVETRTLVLQRIVFLNEQ